MGDFNVNSARRDPYHDFKFKVIIDDTVVAGISKVSALKRSTEVIQHRSGGSPASSQKTPGRTEYDAIVLEKGVTHDTTFEHWANDGSHLWDSRRSTWAASARTSSSSSSTRRATSRSSTTSTAAGSPSTRPLPVLDANGAHVAITLIRLENESWERNTSVPEPSNG